jgi:hypothetical protein
VRVALLALAAACATVPPPPVVVEGCRLTRPPPVPPALQPVGPPTCPAPWEACLTLPDVQQLVAWRRLVGAWTEDAWARCGP